MRYNEDGPKQPTKKLAAEILRVVDKGLCSGVGKGRPGEMCVEAAICYVLEGDGGDDDPECVDENIRDFKINLNDEKGWSSNKARARGMRRAAIAQLGSAGVRCGKFDEFVTEYLHRTLTSRVLRKLVDDVQKTGKIPYFPDFDQYSFKLVSELLEYTKNKKERQEFLEIAAEACVQACIRLKTPGSKWLDLVGGKKPVVPA